MTVMLSSRKNSRDKIWKVIRALREFSIDEVATLTELTPAIVSVYVHQLLNAGYIRQAGIRKEANGRKRLYRLAKNTGPRSPIPCRCIYDPNIDDAAIADQEVKDVA